MALGVDADGVVVAEALPPELSAEQPAQAIATRHNSPATGFGKYLIAYAPALVVARDFRRRMETKRVCAREKNHISLCQMKIAIPWAVHGKRGIQQAIRTFEPVHIAPKATSPRFTGVLGFSKETDRLRRFSWASHMRTRESTT
ncbi:hypothetical protein SGFS_070580 [Streptomyces graminofaciens]|uniref:Transposase n=1 Tax=Streptomyces graminofaciens TaxID=68212 RepID=A0ABN5VQP0_9ACTN|nr:hypothetical protein SGFS_070580 [Streptomyces graminofaciens]